MNYFLDTSALVKIYHIETGSDSVIKVYGSEDIIIISDLGKIEFLSAIFKKYREKDIDEETVNAVIDRFEDDLKNKYKLLKFSSLVLDEAWSLIKKHAKDFSLRTLDSLQLAFFKTYCEDDNIFVCADTRLVKIVELEGYEVLVPK